jgi:hypothetical protein
MKSIITFVLVFFSVTAFSQDSLLSYSKVLTFDSVEQNKLFDRSLIWCSKKFNDSKSAINVKEKEGGVISGKAYLHCVYYIQKKKQSPDTTVSVYYTDYKFDWTIEVKNNKLRFSISQLNCYRTVGATSYTSSYEIVYPVTLSETPPFDYLFTSTEKCKTYWKLSKDGLINNLNLITESLKLEINNKQYNDW